METDSHRELLDRIEVYLDAVPRSATSPEDVGKFTLFRANGPWPYYARPRLGLTDELSAADVDALRTRQRELQLPQNIEWVLETTPSLGVAAAASGMSVVEYPLLVLDGYAGHGAAVPDGVTIRRVGAN